MGDRCRLAVDSLVGAGGTGRNHPYVHDAHRVAAGAQVDLHSVLRPMAVALWQA